MGNQPIIKGQIGVLVKKCTCGQKPCVCGSFVAFADREVHNDFVLNIFQTSPYGINGKLKVKPKDETATSK